MNWRLINPGAINRHEGLATGLFAESPQPRQINRRALEDLLLGNMPGYQDVRAEADSDHTGDFMLADADTLGQSEGAIPDPVHVVFCHRHHGREAEKNIDANDPCASKYVHRQAPRSQIKGSFR